MSQIKGIDGKIEIIFVQKLLFGKTCDLAEVRSTLVPFSDLVQSPLLRRYLGTSR
jgi:hypothetical protein